MKVLVTGGTGFIGRHVVTCLLARGHSVTVLARDPAKLETMPWRDSIAFVASDITQDPPRHEQLGRPDAVMHLAWTGLPNYTSLHHFEDNLPAAYHFLKALVGGGVNHVLVAGTCFEYGLRNGVLSETLPAQPVNAYALAKDTLRRFLEELRREQTDRFVLQWARLFYMYGPGQNPKSLLAQLDAAISAGATEFPMSSGEQLRDYLPVDTVAESLATLLEHPQLDGITNICSGTPISVRRLVEEHLARQGAHLTLRLGRYPYAPCEPLAFWGDATRLRTLMENES